MNRLRLIIGVMLGLAITLFFVGATVYTDWLWFVQLGFRSIFVTSWTYRLGVGFAFGLVTFIILAVNIWLAKKLSPNVHFVSQRMEIERILQQGRTFLDRYFSWAAYLGSAGVALMVGLSMGAFWESWLRFFSASSAGVKDPLFGRDISFYFFTLPVVEIVQGYLWLILIVAFGLAAAVHLIRGSFNISQGLKDIDSKARAHLSVLASLILIVLASEWWMAGYQLVYSKRGVVFGASYTDVWVQLPAYKVLIVVTGIAAVLVFLGGWLKRWFLPIGGLVAIGLAWVVGVAVLPVAVQQYRVAPNEIAKEKPFISRGIKYTRKAFDLENVKRQKFSVEDGNIKETLAQNQGTIDSLRLWDWRPLKKTYGQLQEIRLYYSFRDVDLDRYIVDEDYRQLALSAREMVPDQLPEEANTWINRHFVYTHGYGVVVSPVNEVTREGLPRFMVKNIPPQSSVDSLKVTQPQIYFGEASEDYVVVGTKTKEFDYPAGERNKYTKYKGKDGIKLDSYLNKMAFAYRFGTAKLLISDALTKQSRILMHRNIRDRVATIAPFLSYDPDPYIVIDKGRLYWIIDAYTESDKYPYAKPAQNNRNYIRNSVKVVIDAYNGDVDFYIADDKDPIIATYAKAFPGVFKPLKKMNKGLLKHIRYPEALFKIQAEVYTAFHMTDPQVFFGKEDLWAVPQEIYDSEKTIMDPYYVIMQLPGQKKRQEFVLMLPFTPTNKNNMIAWLAARSDQPNYGELLLYTFPKDKLVFGPMQIESRLDQDPEISRQLSLWNQRGSRVIRGNLLVVPIGKSILFVEPLYLQAEASELPELKRIALSLGDKVVMEPTLKEALESLVGAEETETQPESEPDPSAPKQPASREKLIERAAEAFDKAEVAQKDGDWAGYGRQMEVLKETLEKLAELNN